MGSFAFRFFNKTKGVISAFLVIVLVPIVTMCSLYVDASRIKLARSVIASSGDLALNTVLSNFDADLAEIYGFMASAQDTSEAIESAKEYFKKSMMSQGLESAYATEYANMVGGLMSGKQFDTVQDLLGIKTDSVEIAPVSGANLTNPALVKQQIIEFMKYRGPVEGISELWEKFQQIRNQVNDSKAVTKLTEDADNYYQHQKDAMSSLEKAYEYFLNFNDINNQKGRLNKIPGINESYINKIKKRITDKGQGSIYQKYEEYHKYFLYDLCTYMKYNPNENAFVKTNVLTPNANYGFRFKKNWDKNTFKEQLSSLYTSYNKYLDASRTFKNYVQSTMGYHQGSTYNRQYWIQMQKGLERDNILTNLLAYFDGNNSNSIAYKLARINAALDSLERSEDDNSFLNEEYSNPLSTKPADQTIRACIQSFNNTILPFYNKNASSSMINIYDTVTNRVAGICNSERGSVNQEKGIINQGVASIKEELSKYYSDMKLGIAELNIAKQHLQDAKGYIEQMNSDFETWTSDINSSKISNSNTKKEMDKQYADAKKDIKELNITPQKAQTCINRVGNIKSLLGSVKAALEGFKYYSTAIKDIGSLSDFAYASSVRYDQISIDKGSLDNLFNSTFKNNPQAYKIPNVANCKVTDSNNPNLLQPADQLYMALLEKFPKDPRQPDSDRQEKESQFDNKESEEKSSTDNVDTEGKNNSSNEINQCASLPSAGEGASDGIKVKDGDKSNISNMANAVGNLFTDFGGSMKAARDDLYLLLYISNMFSYDTFTAEKDYEEQKKDGKKDKFARCSLTNYEINSENNYSFGNEIEYIIYGKSNAENKVSSYGTIFAIRYALDLLYALTNFWSGTSGTAKVINVTANGIAAATSGIIPAPLTKIILILMLTGFEAASDLQILRDGHPLAILKDEEVWRWQLKSGGERKDYGLSSIEKANEKKTLIFQYSDYLKLILMLKLIANDTPIVKRVADVVQVNMAKKHEGFLMKNANVYYKLTANCKSSILMLALPVVQQDMQSNEITVQEWNKFSLSMSRGY